MIRAFIAIPLNSALKNEILLAANKLRQVVPAGSAKWVETQNIHLTLKFLGDTDQKILNALIQDLQQEKEAIKQFAFACANLGAFPNAKNPRVIWAGSSSSDHLIHLFKIIENICLKNNFPAEEKPFSPHITLARIKKTLEADCANDFVNAISQFKSCEFGEQVVNEFTLYRSDLKQSGPIYTPIHKFELNP
jgi:2'-5' RNA ligase